MQYVGTNDSRRVIDIDVEKLSFFEAIGILKEDFGYGDQVMRLWWKGGDGEYKEITMELSNHAIANLFHTHLYLARKQRSVMNNSGSLINSPQGN